MDGQKGVAAGRHAEGAPGVEVVGERHTVATHQHDSPDLKGTVTLTIAVFPSMSFNAHFEVSH